MIKFIRSISLILLLIINEEIQNVNGTYYWQYDSSALSGDDMSFYKECWNVPLPDENMYCYGSVGGEDYPIKLEDYRNATELDEMARDDYRGLLYRHMMREKAGDDPTLDCLAIARNMLCANRFRRCGNWNDKFFPR